jgi:hypothetical protein
MNPKNAPIAKRKNEGSLQADLSNNLRTVDGLGRNFITIIETSSVVSMINAMARVDQPKPTDFTSCWKIIG